MARVLTLDVGVEAPNRFGETTAYLALDTSGLMLDEGFKVGRSYEAGRRKEGADGTERTLDDALPFPMTTEA